MSLRNALRMGALNGLIAGGILGFFFKWIESLHLANVYTLLLNVDFISFIPQPLPEWVEFSLHVVVSVGIGIVYGGFVYWKSKPWIWGIVMGCAPIPLFIPLTIWSSRTPEVTDMAALLWWVIGHLLYGIVLALFSTITNKVLSIPPTKNHMKST